MRIQIYLGYLKPVMLACLNLVCFRSSCKWLWFFCWNLERLYFLERDTCLKFQGYFTNRVFVKYLWIKWESLELCRFWLFLRLWGSPRSGFDRITVVPRAFSALRPTWTAQWAGHLAWGWLLDSTNHQYHSEHLQSSRHNGLLSSWQVQTPQDFLRNVCILHHPSPVNLLEEASCTRCPLRTLEKVL